MSNITKRTAEEGFVFAVRYTMQLDSKLFFPFFATSYTEKQSTIEFENAKVPGTLMVNGSIEKFGQSIRKPVLDKKLATIFVFKTSLPYWFNKTEQDILQDSEDNSSEVLEYSDMNSMLDPLLSKVMTT